MTRIAVSIPPVEGNPDQHLGLFVAEVPDDLGTDQWVPLERMETYLTEDPSDGVYALQALVSPLGEVSIWNADLGQHLAPRLTVSTTVARGAVLERRQGVTLHDAGFRIAAPGDPSPLHRGERPSSPARDAYLEDVLAGGPSPVPVGELIDARSMFPDPPGDALQTHSSGSARMAAHYSAAVRRAVAMDEPIPFAAEQLDVNGHRQVHGLFGLGTPFFGVGWDGQGLHRATPMGPYGQKGGWGSTLYGAREHFGRPAGLGPSSYRPDDYLHFAGHQWAAMAIVDGSSAAAYHLVAMIESMWLTMLDGTWDAARAYRFLGDLGEALMVCEDRKGELFWDQYQDHLLNVYIPAVFDKLDGEKARQDDLWAIPSGGIKGAAMKALSTLTLGAVSASSAAFEHAPAWTANVLDRGKADHLKHGQTSWMTGKLAIGLDKLLHWLRWLMDSSSQRAEALLPLFKRARQEWLLAAKVLIYHTWGGEAEPNGRGWFEDASPWGEFVAASKYAITGKYRQYILPACEVIARRARADARAAGNLVQRQNLLALAEDAEARANWLARQLVGHEDGEGWFGSSSAPDKGWGTFLGDEGYLTAGRLGSDSPEGWRSALAGIESNAA